ncbi:hypothetical protein VPH35_029038 [Triticum aestivum]
MQNALSNPLRVLAPYPIPSSPLVVPIHPSRRTTLAPFPSIPIAPPSSLLSAMASALGASPWPPTHPPTTIGAHRRWIRAGEEQLQLWWGASVPKMKEVRRPSLPPRCVLVAAPPLSLSAPSSAAAGTRGRSSPTRLHLSPSCRRTG